MRRILASFAAAALLLGAFLHLLGPASLADQLAGADPAVFALGLVGIVLALACWSEATRRLLRTAGVDVSRRRAFVAYGTGAFGKQVLPMGNAGGPAVMAYAFERETGIGYNRSLAVILVAELLSLAASILLAAVGIALIVTHGAPAGSVRWVAIAMGVLAVVVAGASLAVWYRREGVTAALASGADLLRPVVARVAPGVAGRLEPERVSAGMAGYYATVDEVLADRRGVLVAALLTQLGWVLFVTPLFTSGLALGFRIEVAIVLFLVPAAGLATAVPLPGGLGGLEIALAVLLAALSPLAFAEAGAVVVLYRLCSFWFFVSLGGCCAVVAATSVPNLADSVEAPVAALEESPAERDGSG